MLALFSFCTMTVGDEFAADDDGDDGGGDDVEIP